MANEADPVGAPEYRLTDSQAERMLHTGGAFLAIGSFGAGAILLPGAFFKRRPFRFPRKPVSNRPCDQMDTARGFLGNTVAINPQLKTGKLRM